MYRKIIAVFMAAMVVATTCVVPSFATDYQSTYNFWNWLYDNSWFVGKTIASLSDCVCSVSEDGLHHATVPAGGFSGGDREGIRTYVCICDYCAQEFEATATELENTYNDWDSKQPDSVDSSGNVSGVGEWVLTHFDTYSATYNLRLSNANSATVSIAGKSYSDLPSKFRLAYKFKVSSDCEVYFDGPFLCSSSYFGIEENTDAFYRFYYENQYDDMHNAGVGTLVDGVRIFTPTQNTVYRYSTDSFKLAGGSTAVVGQVDFVLPSVYIKYRDPSFLHKEIPVFSVGDVDVDLSNYDSWAFDYTTRTFTGYTEDGDVKIVYGDENVTVIEGGNTYNYYYASTDGDGSGSGNGSGDDGGEGLFGKLGELLGTLLGGLLDLVTGVLSGILDSLISLVEMTIEKLGSVVNLFGSFGDALRALWSWLPEDIITILSAGVSVVIFAAVLKLFI